MNDKKIQDVRIEAQNTRIGSSGKDDNKAKSLLDEYEQSVKNKNKSLRENKLFDPNDVKSFSESNRERMAKAADEYKSTKEYLDYLKEHNASATEIESVEKKLTKQEEKLSSAIQKDWNEDYKLEMTGRGLEAKIDISNDRMNKTKMALDDTKAKGKKLLQERDEALKNNDKQKLAKLDKEIAKNADLAAQQEARYTSQLADHKELQEKYAQREQIKERLTSPIRKPYNSARETVVNSRPVKGVSKSAPVRKIESIRDSFKKGLDGISNSLNTMSSNVRNGVRRGLNASFTAAKNAIFALLKAIGVFLITPPLGWICSGCIIIGVIVALASVLAVSDATESYKLFDYENAVDIPTDAETLGMEYKGWINTYKDEEDGPDSFYKEYRSIVTADKIAVIAYVFRDELEYDNLRSDMNYEYLADPNHDLTMEGLQAMNDKIMETYYRDYDVVDKYTLRQLYLDRIDYHWSYLYREYTDWTIYNFPEIDRDAVRAKEAEMYNEAIQHDEYIAYTQEVTIFWYEEVEDWSWVEEEICDEKGKNCKMEGGYKKTGTHSEKRTDRQLMTFYKYRDIIDGSENWVSSYNDYPLISESVKAGIEHYRDSLHADLPGVLVEDKDWIKIYYGENGIATKRVKYWVLKDYEEVVDLIVNHYYPTTPDPEYAGDSFQLTFISEVDSNDNRTITIDKRQLYPLYYANRGTINQEHMFDEYWRNDWMQELEVEKMMFEHYAGFVEFQMAEGKFLISPFINSIPDASKYISRGYIPAAQHLAIDIACPYQTPINASLSGTVIKVVNNIPENTSSTCYQAPTSAGCHGVIGNEVQIQSKLVDTEGVEHDVIIMYYHNYVGSAMVSVGDTVEAGQIIAREGHNGLSTGPHLHFVFIVDGERIDAAPYIQWTSSGEYVEE